jgi:hypothetical protein
LKRWYIGFVATSRDEGDAFRRARIDAGYTDNRRPSVREQYSSEEAALYHAAFLLDPDGSNIEAATAESFEPVLSELLA